jgi:hypothetical protein
MTHAMPGNRFPVEVVELCARSPRQVVVLLLAAVITGRSA